MKAIQSPNDEGGKAIETDNLSFEQLIQQLNPEASQPGETTEEESEEETEQESEEVIEGESQDETEESGEEESEDESEEESEEIDLLDLTPEQIQTLAKKGKSRLLERIGELTAQKKALQAQLEEVATSKPSVKTIPQELNPFKQLTTVEEIKAKYEEFENTLETTDRLLEEYEDYHNDDIIEVGGQQFTKLNIKQANRNARDAIAKYLPAQASHLQSLESIKTANQQWQDMAKKEIPEIQDEESEIGKAFSQLVSDPLVAELKDKLPHLGVQIEYLLAHVARSKFGQKAKKVTQGAGNKLKVKPPASPVGATASRNGTSQSGKYAEMMKRFEQTGSAEDWIAAQKFKTN
jgi:hypothetical protein